MSDPEEEGSLAARAARLEICKQIVRDFRADPEARQSALAEMMRIAEQTLDAMECVETCTFLILYARHDPVRQNAVALLMTRVDELSDTAARVAAYMNAFNVSLDDSDLGERAFDGFFGNVEALADPSARVTFYPM
jgi:hypothetical protein